MSDDINFISPSTVAINRQTKWETI